MLNSPSCARGCEHPSCGYCARGCEHPSLRISKRVEVLSILLLSVAGCFQTRPCGAVELCNYEDDNCNGVVDEGFADPAGNYTSADNCGACGVRCSVSFPTASTTACTASASAPPMCRLVTCPPNTQLIDASFCSPITSALCLPCENDALCKSFDPSSTCLSGRCLPSCANGCPAGFACRAGVCQGDCACSAATEGEGFACLVTAPDGKRCAGLQMCSDGRLDRCAPALEEACNLADDDCDGSIDEDFRNARGQYVTQQHCGACANPCAPPGPNMTAECLADPNPGCAIRCNDGFVDVDRIAQNGCECERWTGNGPPPGGRGDSDCDGIVDVTDDFVYVTMTGSDAEPGNLERPLRTISAALARAAATSPVKSVLVARGIYDGPITLRTGISVFGGYRPDFRDRNLELYPVVIEGTGAAGGGAPVLIARQISIPTRFDGFTILGSDAVTPGDSSTTAVFEDCTTAMQVSHVTFLAGRGADGSSGAPSSDRVRTLGFASLLELNGSAGDRGGNGTPDGGSCSTVVGGSPGVKICRRRDVSGGRGGGATCVETGCMNGSACANAGCTDFTVAGVCDTAQVMRLALANIPAESGEGVAGGQPGENTYNAPTNRVVCNFCDDNPTLARSGENGFDGATGENGGGGSGCAGDQTIDFATGRVRSGGGGEGTDGADGSGGGGGSAGAGYDVIGGTSGRCSDQSGGSGGGGGSGGCGAPGGGGGQGGGASIGVLVRGTVGGGVPTFADSRVVKASGGAGGDGGNGASGGAGGGGANGGVGAHWCARAGGRGGDGGRGGSGGGGGGGCGGASHAILVRGAADAYRAQLQSEVTVDGTGRGGRGGEGGFAPMSEGDDGAAGAEDGVVVLTAR